MSESRKDLIFADLVRDQLVLVALSGESLDATAVRDAGARGVLVLTRSADRIAVRAEDHVSAPMRRLADVGRNNCSVAILHGRSCFALVNKRHFSRFKHILVPTDASFLFALIGFCRYLPRGTFRIVGKTNLACGGYNMRFIVLENRFVPGANARLYGPAGKTPLEILHEFSGINYVLLRSIESIENGSHTGDIDLLVSAADLDRLKLRLLTRAGTYPLDVYTEAGEHGHSYIGVPYFKPSLAKQMLATADVRPSGIRTASAKWGFLSYCYHLLFHNRLAIGSKGGEILDRGVFRKPGNFDELKRRAVAAKIEVPRTIRHLEQVLHAENAFPSIDLIGFYSRKSPGLRRRYLEHGKAKPGLSVFFVRDFGAGLACVPVVRDELKAHFTILTEGPVTSENEREILSDVRGGNWQDQSAPGGIAKPIYWFVCWDDRPIPPSRKTRRKYPRLDNERIRLKADIRKQVGVTTHKPQALVHSSDNTFEALEHIKKIGASGHPAVAALCPVEKGEHTAAGRARHQ